jgi:hypothetical protein
MDEDTRYDILFNFGDSTSLRNLEAHIKKYPELRQNLINTFNDNLRQKNLENLSINYSCQKLTLI